MGLVLLRLALFAGGVIAALFLGVWPLVGYMVGFIIARTLAVRAAKSEAPLAPASGKEENQVHG